MREQERSRGRVCEARERREEGTERIEKYLFWRAWGLEWGWERVHGWEGEKERDLG